MSLKTIYYPLGDRVALSAATKVIGPKEKIVGGIIIPEDSESGARINPYEIAKVLSPGTDTKWVAKGDLVVVPTSLIETVKVGEGHAIRMTRECHIVAKIAEAK